MDGAVATGATPPSERWVALGAFLLALFYLCVLAWLGLFVAVPALGFGFEPVVITSGSMQPGIRPGDIVLLRVPADPTVLSPGTVVTFADATRPDVLTTHRIAAVNPDGTYRTRGDANAGTDSTPLDPDRIVGVARMLVPLAGLPVTWLDSASGAFAAWAALTATACVVALRPPHDGEPVTVEDGVAAPAGGA